MEENKKIIGETINQKEEKILHFWRDNKIFEKSIEKPAGLGAPRGEFVFYDGPPFGNGPAHYGHLLAGTIKDVIPRYKTMKGFRVERRWGWDCHGLPVENFVEKELELKSKKDIETFGVKKFCESCRESVLRFEKEWKQLIPRVGRFVDMEHPYKTMDASFTESIWWVFKTLYDKGLTNEGYKSMHLCPRCETTLSNFEVAQGYKDITDNAVTVKFELVDEPGTYFLAWTTTPWTLPGNVALAINKDITYAKVSFGDDYYIMSKALLPRVFEGEAAVVEEFSGEKLVGKKYKPLYDYYSSDENLANLERGWKVCAAPFVSAEDGTGIVHIAPAFGEDDMRLGQEENLPFVQHVDMRGRFRPEVMLFAGLPVKPKGDHQRTDLLVIKELEERGLLFKKEPLLHSYPHCWRCDTPLLNYASSSWFVSVPKIKDALLANNKKTTWVPENLRDGRFGKWLEGARDWAISRSRYWGAPLPVWRCGSCNKIDVVGSVADLRGKTGSGNNFYVMRHGQADSNVKGVLSSDPKDENHLTSTGVTQVKEGAKKILDLPAGQAGKKIDLIVSSDMYRARETSELVAEAIGYDKNKIVYDARLREIGSGTFDRGSAEAYHKYFYSLEEKFTKAVPEGENGYDIRRRVMESLYEINSKYEGKNILIVSHGDPIWYLLTGARGLNPKESVALKEAVQINNAEVCPFEFTPFPHNDNYELDLHKPYIDDVQYKCECGGHMARVSEVFDCWFESGSMPYAQLHYPFENKEKFENNFPAEFIAEGVDQTRGWFYSLMVLSSALFDKPAFKNVVVNGIILAEDGQKMSKRLKNYPDPIYVVEKYGADALRYYMMASSVVRAEDLRFSEKGVDEVYKKVILRAQNVLSFYEMYKNDELLGNAEVKTEENVLDKWIEARLNALVGEVGGNLDRYELDKAARPIADFVDDLSTWYLRRSRDRFKSDSLVEKKTALVVMRGVLLGFSRVIAPFMPFLAEYIYGRAGGERESVHLETWLEVDHTIHKGSVALFEDMATLRLLASAALDERKKAGLPVRQPLASVAVKDERLAGKNELLEILKDEVNVRGVVFDPKQESPVVLDLNITDELRAEGYFRELTRGLQDTRKRMGLSPSDKVSVSVFGGEKEVVFINKFNEELKKAITASAIVFACLPDRQADTTSGTENIVIGDMTFNIALSVA